MKLRYRIKRAARRKVRAKVTTPAKRAVRREVRKRPLFQCGSCGKQYSNPLGHTCGNAGDFGKRRRAKQRAERAEARKAKRAGQRKRVNERIATARKKERERADQRVSAARRRERARAAERVAKAKAARKLARRPGRPSHDYRKCRDHDCERAACEAYREGVNNGMDAAEG
jgi:hypothetical protein